MARKLSQVPKPTLIVIYLDSDGGKDRTAGLSTSFSINTLGGGNNHEGRYHRSESSTVGYVDGHAGMKKIIPNLHASRYEHFIIPSKAAKETPY